MDIADMEMTLGTVIDEVDKEGLGRVKVGAFGQFDRRTMSIDAIPPARPFTMSGSSNYAQPYLGQKVWLLHNKNSEDEYWYIPFHELNQSTKEILKQSPDCDVLLAKQKLGSTVQLYQSQGDGFVMKNGDAALKLDNEGAISLQTDKTGNNVGLKIEGNAAVVGDETNPQPMVLGDNLMQTLSQLATDLQQAAVAANEDGHSAALCGALQQASKNLINGITNLTSQSAKVGL